MSMSGEEDEVSLAPTLTVDHAPSSRAFCHSTRCLFDNRTDDEKRALRQQDKKFKIKGTSIPKGSLRVTKNVVLPMFGDHGTSFHFHLPCFFWEETHHKAKTGCLSSTEQLAGLDKLKRSEVEVIERMVEHCAHVFDRWKDRNSRRSFTEKEQQERSDEKEDWMSLAEGEDAPLRDYDYDPNEEAMSLKSALARKSRENKKLKDVGKEEEEDTDKKSKKRSRSKKSLKDEEDREDDEDDVPKKKKKVTPKSSLLDTTSSVDVASSGGYDASGYAPLSHSAPKKTEGFLKMLTRPSKLGASRDPPKGKDNCLSGKSFVLTGILESLTVNEFKQMVERFGGKVTGAVSGKTNYLIRGEQCGEKKIETAVQKNVPIIDEDRLYALIEELPGQSDELTTLKSESKAKAKAKPVAKKKWKKLTDEDDDDDEVGAEGKEESTTISRARKLPLFMP